MPAEFSWKGIRESRMLFRTGTKEEGLIKEKRVTVVIIIYFLKYKNKMQRSKWIHSVCYVTKCTAKK